VASRKTFALESSSSDVPFEYPIPKGAKADNASEPGFRAVVQALLDAVDTLADPEGTLAALEQLGLDTVDPQDEVVSKASGELTLILGCVETFRERPTAATWEYLWSLAWHSASLKHGLPRAAIEAAKADRQFLSKFLEVATEVIEHAIANPHRRVAARERGRSKQYREAWDSRPLLGKLWSGIDRHGIILPTDDDGVFGVIAELDLKTFMDLLVRRGDPYAIDATLLTASGYWSFERWQALVEIAPTAFDSDGQWNGSVILSRESLKMAVAAVGVDLRGSLALLEKLVELAPQRIGIGTEQLRAAQSLLD